MGIQLFSQLSQKTHRGLCVSAALCTLSAMTLSGCSIFSQPQPQPDPTLLEFYHTALAQNRHDDAAVLEREIIRLCGHYKNGDIPDSCDAESLATTAPTSDDTPTSSRIFQKIGDVDRQSLPIVVEEYAKLCAQGEPVDLAPQASVNDHDDLTTLRTALNHEKTLMYAFGLARAFADSATQEKLDVLTQTHLNRINTLELSLPADQEIPAQAPAYRFDQYTTVSDEPTAAIFLSELLDDDLSFWKNTASQAHETSWRALSLSFAGDSAKAQAVP
ncbi:DUF4439 domain-containing protein [Corynebacterium sp. sy039]|uniref:DUF4439 domain-containing protein n=1 Tax=Corynebacterium sp. sy039 TaxID=2599641 RepID=UPI0011B6640F|nr:DUF4439 domain-containing protein [Corynebacterium sp. sy039]QDZ42799.1 DUF4439 domain-containing protein [Corynebacterium sp. sy039]